MQRPPHRLMWLAPVALAVACAPSPPRSARVPGVASSSSAATARPRAEAGLVRGRVLDHAGRPLREAWARLIGPSDVVEGEVRADAAGGFSLPIDGAPRSVRRVDLSGDGHRTTTLLIATDALPVDVTVKLGSYGTPSVVDGITLRVSPAPRDWMVAQGLTKGDGFYDAEVSLPDGKYPFRIATSGPPKSVVLSDGYLTVVGHKARVAFDPTSLPPPGVAPAVTWSAAGSASAGLSEVWSELTRASSEYRAVELGAGRPASTVTTPYDWSAPRARLDAVARRYPAALVQEAAGVAYFAEGTFPTRTADVVTRARKVVASVPAGDALWSLLGRDAFANVAAAAGEAWTSAYVQGFLHEQTDDHLVLDFLAAELLRAGDDRDHAREVASVVKQPRFAHASGVAYILQLDPDGPTAPGQPVPAFEGRALHGDRVDAHERVTPKSLEKKLYLLDVWATWCTPCVAEIAQLHALYGEYGPTRRHGRRLEILSLALDHDAQKVIAFRKDPAHPMPWLNAVADDDERKAFFKALGYTEDTTIVPFCALVDEDGKIVEATPRLRGDNLAATLERVLGAPR